jgi:putative membrane protein insertion efficiency factor
MRDAAKFVVVRFLQAYKWAISPLFPPACRYVPTCSDYAIEAVERYGVLRGGFMALWRLLRCHPFARGGYDPVVANGSAWTSECNQPETWKSGALAPRPADQLLPGFSPCDPAQHMKRNA